MTARFTTLVALLVACIVLVARPAAAQVSVQAVVSDRKVEIGQPFQFQITAMGSGGVTPRDPVLAAPPGIEVTGPSVGTNTQISVNNGRMTQRIGISATWNLVARRVGTFRIGPATVDVDGKRVRTETTTVEVVAQGGLPRQRRFDPFSFDPFGSGSPFGRSPFGQDPFGQPEQEPPPVPEEYRVERAPDPVAFVRTVVTPARPVVGEQVTLKIYAYGGRGGYNVANESEPSRADFLTYSVVDSPLKEDAVRVRIGDQDFIAIKMRELALFPLHSGDLDIGPMQMTFQGGHYRASTPIVRQSERVVVHVTEPPLKGRPPGYKIGDVGQLELSAHVDPLRITAGDGVSVVAKLSGTGNLPLSLIVPQQRGVEWLEPSTTEDIDAKGPLVKGFRVFTYVVKLSEPGRIDLGDLTLPYFDPKKRSYEIARATLGKVQVDPNPARVVAASPSASAASAESTLAAAIPAARRTLGPHVRATAPFTDGLGFWALLLGTPLAVALTGSGLELGRRLNKRVKERRTDPDRLAADALREADEAARSGRRVETAGAVERALFRAIEAGTGLKARALLRTELASALASKGVPKETLDATLSLLDVCESARFTEASSEDSPKALAERARAVSSELIRKRQRK